VSALNKEEDLYQIHLIILSQLELEKRLERIKVDLALRTDFNLIDTFRIFDYNGKGWITPEEIANGLFDFFSITVQPRDLMLYMNRYDKDRDGRLKYSEFCDSFLPIDPFHAGLLAKKAPLHMKEIQSIRKDLLFYPETREILIACWRMHFEQELEAERIRV
jgi:hypothetical protein